MEELLKKINDCDSFILLRLIGNNTQGYNIDIDVCENLTIKQVDEILIKIVNNRKKL